MVILSAKGAFKAISSIRISPRQLDDVRALLNSRLSRTTATFHFRWRMKRHPQTSVPEKHRSFNRSWLNRPTINFSCCCCGGYFDSLGRELKHLQTKSGLIDLGLSICSCKRHGFHQRIATAQKHPVQWNLHVPASNVVELDVTGS